MDKKIIRLPRKFSTCIGCGDCFIPLRPWHRACRQCWSWHRALTGVEATQRALESLREVR